MDVGNKKNKLKDRSGTAVVCCRAYESSYGRLYTTGFGEINAILCAVKIALGTLVAEKHFEGELGQRLGRPVLDLDKRRAINPDGSLGRGLDLIIDVAGFSYGSYPSTSMAPILVALVSLVYPECKPVPGVAMLGELYHFGPIVQLQFVVSATHVRPLLSPSSPIKTVLVPMHIKATVDAAVAEAKAAMALEGVEMKKEGLEVKTYSNLAELLSQSLTLKTVNKPS